MLLIYLVVMGLGIGIFLIVFFREFGGGASSAGGLSLGKNDKLFFSAPEQKDLPASGAPIFKPKSERKPLFSFSKKPSQPSLFSSSLIKNEPAPEAELQDIKQALVDKLDQKCVKLERILDEKNRILDQMQKDLENERSHRGEFESLKSILQQQIDELKTQNRKLREELERVLQESLRVQAGLSVSPSVQRIQEKPAVSPESEYRIKASVEEYVSAVPDDIIPAPAKKTEDISGGAAPEAGGISDQKGSLNLHDIFGDEDKK